VSASGTLSTGGVSAAGVPDAPVQHTDQRSHEIGYKDEAETLNLAHGDDEDCFMAVMLQGKRRAYFHGSGVEEGEMHFQG